MYKNLGCGHIGVKANLRQAFDYAVRYGFQGIIPDIGELEDMSEGDRQSLVGAMKEKGVCFGAAGLPVEFRRDEDRWKSDMAKLPRQSEIFKNVGVTRVVTWIVPGDNHLTYREHFQQLRIRLGEAARVFESDGIRLGLEFIGPYTVLTKFRYPFARTQKEMLELCEAIGTDNMGLLYDAYHWYNSQGTVEEIEELTKEQIVEVHANDAPEGLTLHEQEDLERELPCATGVIDLKGFMRGLRTIGYDGPVTVEPFNQVLRDMPDEKAVQETSKALDCMFSLM